MRTESAVCYNKAVMLKTKEVSQDREETQTEKVYPIKKIWVDTRTGLLGVGTNAFVLLQAMLMMAVYILLAVLFRPFFYLSLALTAATAVGVLLCEKDGQSKASWLFVLLISCGSGYIIYFMADRRVCYGNAMRRFGEIRRRTARYAGEFRIENASRAVANDCEYIYRTGGFVPYTNTCTRYFSDGAEAFAEILKRISEARNFVFMEYFMVSDGSLLDELIEIFRDRCAAGVAVRLLYDDVGSAKTLTTATKNRIKEAGVELEVFSKMFSPAHLGLNFRDHRKIVVVDGKTGFVAGCNLTDNCVNRNAMEGIWKDAGVRMDGAAVDGLSLCFMRQWEFATQKSLDFAEYLNLYDAYENTAHVVPYAGGPELGGALCRGVYSTVVTGARERLYIMSPYFIPDSGLFNQIRDKALSGVDVRLVLPSVPDYTFVHRVTCSNAEKLMKCGAKVYYMEGAFVHAKVMLTENCMTVGSVNIDMRAFYQELDNGVYTDDPAVMEGALDDFTRTFRNNVVQEVPEHSVWDRFVTAVCRLISPLL